MLKQKYRNLLYLGAYIVAIGTIALCITMLVSGINNYMKDNVDYDYGIYGVFEELEVVNEEINTTTIIKPYISENVKIGKYFYDYESDKEEQESSLVYYENTYMQNSGIDYISDESFDVVAILDGEVISVKDDELLGTTIQIKHSNDLISLYQGIANTTVTEGAKVNQGAILATSGTNTVNREYTNMLHFEIYHKGEVLDPENIYNLNIEDFR